MKYKLSEKLAICLLCLPFLYEPAVPVETFNMGTTTLKDIHFCVDFNWWYGLFQVPCKSESINHSNQDK